MSLVAGFSFRARASWKHKGANQTITAMNGPLDAPAQHKYYICQILIKSSLLMMLEQ